MSVLYKQSTYEDRIVSQSLNLANMFLTSSNAQYWAGKNNHHGVIVSFDWLPSSGSLSLLEANVTIAIESQHVNNNWNAEFSQSIGLMVEILTRVILIFSLASSSIANKLS